MLRITCVFVLLAACSGGPPDEGAAEGFLTWDSAGIVIAESESPLWTPDIAWRIDPEAFLVIGSADGDPPGTDFTRPSSALRLRDGRVLIAEPASREVRVFGADGLLLERLGGLGEGPGEIRLLGTVGVIRGDSVVVRDAGGFSTSVFSTEGALGRTIAGPPAAWNGLRGVVVVGWLEDGSFIVSHNVQPGQIPVQGRVLVEQEWHYFDAEGTHLGRIVTLPAFYADDRRTVAFGPRYGAEVTPSGFWFGFPDRYELRHYGARGLERVVRRRWQAEPVPPEAVEAFQREVSPDPAAFVFADRLPAFAAFRVSPDGHLWVQEHPTQDDYRNPEAFHRENVGWRRWTVFDPEGRWLGAVELPEGVVVREIGADYLLGWTLDDLEVPYLVLHEIVKP